MVERFMHAEGIIECRSVFAGPCMCGPAVHINLGEGRTSVTATCILSLDECEELIKQIRGSMRAVRKATH
jgi:hypothetical protein